MTNVTLTTEQAQQIEQAEQEPTVSDGVCGGCAKKAADGWALYCVECWEKAEQPVSQEYQDHLVNQSFDWAAMAAKHQFMEGYRIGLAEMREKCAKVCDDKHDYMCSRAAAAIRAIKFEGDTGFRPVSEMIAEHKQDPKKAAAIEKAKMRKAEQEPVAVVKRQVGNSLVVHITGNVSAGDLLYAAPQPMKQEPVAWKCSCGANLYVDSNGAPASKAGHEPECKYKEAYTIWQDKTEWVQETAHPKELGMHRADALRQRIENLQNAATHPVRTKDLTDDEIADVFRTIHVKESWSLGFARAVIKADRELNK